MLDLTDLTDLIARGLPDSSITDLSNLFVLVKWARLTTLTDLFDLTKKGAARDTHVLFVSDIMFRDEMDEVR